MIIDVGTHVIDLTKIEAVSKMKNREDAGDWYSVYLDSKNNFTLEEEDFSRAELIRLWKEAKNYVAIHKRVVLTEKKSTY